MTMQNLNVVDNESIMKGFLHLVFPHDDTHPCNSGGACHYDVVMTILKCPALSTGDVRVLVSYTIVCPIKFCPICATFRTGCTMYVRLRNLAHREKFPPTKKYSCETPPMNAALYHFPQSNVNPRRQ
ncbi:hypothetical protein Y032_0854g2702 [Ancylostoma ceylanicum]|uniref:Uncharacterized protein n=1 Tax=Ancylostoma ceylanicum TaxID=53326 RepID=A0A016WAD2_9BILA|nr:hypothetical protein Y032_0854g2702 [Ancylostoma ceylanicum]